jgi:hypothetical protein
MTHLQAEWQPIPEVFFFWEPLGSVEEWRSLEKKEQSLVLRQDRWMLGPHISHSHCRVPVCPNHMCKHHLHPPCLLAEIKPVEHMAQIGWNMVKEFSWGSSCWGYALAAWLYGCAMGLVVLFWGKTSKLRQFSVCSHEEGPCRMLFSPDFVQRPHPMWGIYGPYASKEAKRSRKKLHEVTWRLQCHLHQPAKFPQWHGRTVLTTAWDQKQTVVKGFAWRYDGRGTAYCHQGCGWKSICNL